MDANLAKLEKELASARGLVTDKAKAAEFIKISEEYAEMVRSSNPNKNVDLLLKAAGLAKSVDDPHKAIELYTNVAEKMPQHPKAPMALFMTGFIYENDLNDTAKAKQIYEHFLQQYPNDPDFADDATSALKLLGKPLDEVIKGFEQQNQGSK
jgi:tetratricopeptide (TPR) repeat protein